MTRIEKRNFSQKQKTLYEPTFEKDNCGIGAVANIDGSASRKIVDDALCIVERLEHRAGKDASGQTGDGVGILLQIPHGFFSDACQKGEIEAADGSACQNLGQARDYGIGMFFFPADFFIRAQAKRMVEKLSQKEGLEFLGWRKVPVCQEVLGQKAKDCMPCIEQCFVRRPKDTPRGIDFDRKLYILRRQFERSTLGTYVCSFSSRTIVYKGMFLVKQLRTFYKDLQSPLCQSALAIVHSRFSTNTNPSWMRAHPNRLIAHNGEINTIRGNVDRMLAREETLRSPKSAKGTWKKFFRRWTKAARIQPCWTTRWNFL